MVLSDVSPKNPRAVLTVVGIAVGVAALVSLLAVGQGMRASIRGTLRGLVNMGFVVMPSGGSIGLGVPGSGPAGASGGAMDLSLAREMGEIPGVSLVTPTLVQVGFTERTGDSALLVVGTPLEGIERALPGLAEGSYPRGEGEALLGATAAELVGASPGDVLEVLRRPGDRSGLRVRVAGILSPSGTILQDQAVYVPLEAAQEFYGMEGKVTVVFVRVDDPEAAGRVGEILSEKFPDLMVLGTDQVMENVESILRILDAALAAIGGISMFIAGLSITNSVMMNVSEKVREIGILKAMGYTRREILGIFLLEGLIYSAVGGPAGVALGAAAAGAASTLLSVGGYSLPVRLGPAPAAAGVAMAVVVSLAAAAPPAKRAADVRVVEALARE